MTRHSSSARRPRPASCGSARRKEVRQSTACVNMVQTVDLCRYVQTHLEESLREGCGEDGQLLLAVHQPEGV